MDDVSGDRIARALFSIFLKHEMHLSMATSSMHDGTTVVTMVWHHIN